MRTREEIQRDIRQTEDRLRQLKVELASTPPPSEQTRPAHELSPQEYKRYGRQMILNAVGLPGQVLIKRAHILVIGAGGLGCPVLLYLAAAGVGEITILDHDDVELSNLHRQVLHTEQRIGMPKAVSAKLALQALNSDVIVNAHVVAFTPALFHSPQSPHSPASVTAEEPPFTLILDCTDNPATRHFLNAYAVAHRIPLVSGGAVRTDGTVGVYGLRISEVDFGPCYACVFPPPATVSEPALASKNENVSPEEAQLRADLAAERVALAGTGACSDEGVLGILCGIVGLQMAAEAFKVILRTANPALHMISALGPTPMRTIKVRQRKESCPACGTGDQDELFSQLAVTRDQKTLSSTPTSRWRIFLTSGTWPGWIDPLCERPGPGSEPLRSGERRVTPSQLHDRRSKSGPSEWPTLIDVRPRAEFGICAVMGSVNVSFPEFLRNPARALRDDDGSNGMSDIYLICRRGNDSRIAARALQRHFNAEWNSSTEKRGPPLVYNIAGGLDAWRKEVDSSIPMY